MSNLRIVRVPLLERVVLEELAIRWEITADEALARLIRRAARQEVVGQPKSPPASDPDQAQAQTAQEVAT